MSDYTTGSGAPRADVLPLEAALGRQIKHLRTSLGLTGAEFAASASISASMLSKIETGQISPSLRTLQDIAQALNVPITSLFAEHGRHHQNCSYVPAGTGVAINRRGSKAGHRYQLLGHSFDGDLVVEPYLITLLDDAVPYTGFQHAGRELIYMLSGEVTYRHGDKYYDLAPGDTLLFDSTAPHGPEVLKKLPMTYLSIIIYTRD